MKNWIGLSLKKEVACERITRSSIHPSPWCMNHRFPRITTTSKNWGRNR